MKEMTLVGIGLLLMEHNYHVFPIFLFVLAFIRFVMRIFDD